MQVIKQEKFNKKLSELFEYEFKAQEEGLYIIEIGARARSEKQIGPNETDDDDLRIEIDSRNFPKLNNAQRYLDSEASFSGGKLRNLKEIIYFLIYFSKGSHTLRFIPDRNPILEDLSIKFTGNKISDINLEINQQAENGDRRPWITFVLVNLPLKFLRAEATTKWRLQDSDDLKLIIDNKIQENKFSIFHKNWLWSGSVFKKLFQSETQIKTIKTNFSSGLRYIEFWADRMPVLHRINFDFGLSTKRIPDVYDPEWTGNFNDDSEQIILARLILGEAEDQSREAKIWVGDSVLNRIKNKAWPNIVHEVILQSGQFDPFKSNDSNFYKIIDPLQNANQPRLEAWRESYEIANSLLSGEILNSTTVTHFHGRGVSKDWFINNVVPNGKFLKQIDDTYFYWSPN